MTVPLFLKGLLRALSTSLSLFQTSRAAAEGCCRPAPAAPAAQRDSGRWRATPGQSVGRLGGPSRCPRAYPLAPALLSEAAFGGCSLHPLACPMRLLTMSPPCLASVCRRPFNAMIPMERGKSDPSHFATHDMAGAELLTASEPTTMVSIRKKSLVEDEHSRSRHTVVHHAGPGHLEVRHTL